MEFYSIFILVTQLSIVNDTLELFERGGPVLWVIICVAISLLVIAVERFWYLFLSYRACQKELNLEWQVSSLVDNWLSHKVREGILARYRLKLYQGISSIKVLILLCPLFGLLGTVTGMISVFDVMAYSGTGNARLMASGISKATIPTLSGMFVAIVGLFLINQIERLAQIRYERFSNAIVFNTRRISTTENTYA